MNNAEDADLVAVLELSDNASEDAWGQTSWHAEVAVRAAAADAGVSAAGGVSWSDAGRTLLLPTVEGRCLAARIVVGSTYPVACGVARPPTDAELVAWRDYSARRTPGSET